MIIIIYDWTQKSEKVPRIQIFIHHNSNHQCQQSAIWMVLPKSGSNKIEPQPNIKVNTTGGTYYLSWIRMKK